MNAHDQCISSDVAPIRGRTILQSGDWAADLRRCAGTTEALVVPWNNAVTAADVLCGLSASLDDDTLPAASPPMDRPGMFGVYDRVSVDRDRFYASIALSAVASKMLGDFLDRVSVEASAYPISRGIGLSE